MLMASTTTERPTCPMPINRLHLVTAAAIGGAALGGAALANGATSTTTQPTTTQTTTTSGSSAPADHRGNPNETPLTGDTLKSASDAALAANAGAKVDVATTEDPAEN